MTTGSSADPHFFSHFGKTYFRSDLQGLRAIGALMIMVFHIWFNKVSGGVDVFIVVSGYLMTGVLLKGWMTSGNMAVPEFWSRIIGRIAPSAYTVLGVTVVTGYFILPPSVLDAFLRESKGALLQIENLQLIRKSVDYLASDLMPSPVQQFWALSVQMQFYVVLPFVLIPLAALSRSRNSVAPIVIGYGVLLLASFTYAVVSVSSAPTATYFNPVARGWEFIAGGLLYLVAPWVKPRKRGHARFASVLGLVLVFCGAILVPKGAGYPGVVALIPVSAALLIIWAGVSGVYQNWLLSTRALTFLGGLSFTIYLWHWPLLVFYKERLNTLDVPLRHGIGIIVLSIALAFLTHQMESAIRRRAGKSGLAAAIIGVLFVVPTGALVYYVRGDLYRVQQEVLMKWERYDYSEVQIEGGIHVDTSSVIRRSELIAARNILPAPYRNGCHQDILSPEVKLCSYGDSSASRSVVLVGGSHALQWLPALDAIGKRTGLKIYSMTKSSCTFGALKSADQSCFEWNEEVLKTIQEVSPVLVITNSTRTSVRDERIPEEYVQSWRAVKAMDIPLVGIRDNPRLEFDVPECLHRNAGNYMNCAVSRSEYLDAQDPALKYREVIHSVDMTEYLCTNEICPASFKELPLYRDRHHIHFPYVMMLNEALEHKIVRASPGIFE